MFIHTLDCYSNELRKLEQSWTEDIYIYALGLSPSVLCFLFSLVEGGCEINRSNWNREKYTEQKKSYMTTNKFSSNITWWFWAIYVPYISGKITEALLLHNIAIITHWQICGSLHIKSPEMHYRNKKEKSYRNFVVKVWNISTFDSSNFIS
jgi:hypothetical protein